MPKREILICAGTGCLSSGAEEIEERLMDELWEHGLEDRGGSIISRAGS